MGHPIAPPSARRVLAVLAGLIPTACAPIIPHRIQDRVTETASVITLEHLPPHARVMQELGKTRRTIALENMGQTQVTLKYRATEHVDNGDVSQHKDQPTTLNVVIEAPEYLPRKLTLHAPGDTTIDAHLDRPALYYVDPKGGPKLDRVLTESLEGDCVEATADSFAASVDVKAALQPSLAECHERSARRHGSSESRDWDPKSLGIPGDVAASPEHAISEIEALAKKESDPVTKAAVDAIRALVSRGELDEAAHIAELTAIGLPTKRDALVLQLPAAFLASSRTRVAYSLVVHKNERAAMDVERRALAIAPLVAAWSYPRVRHARARELTALGTKYETKSPLVARGFFLAATTTDPSVKEAQSGLDRTAAAVANAAHVHLTVSSPDDTSARELATQLAGLVPKHVTVDVDRASPAAILYLAVSDTQRTVDVSETQGSKTVVAFTITKHNDAYDQAQSDLQLAEQEMQNAQQTYDQAQANAKQEAAQANQGGLAGAIAGVGAITQEGLGTGFLIAAQNNLRDARAKAASTPPTIQEDEKRDAKYPILHFRVDATRVVKTRLDGFGAPIESTQNATAHLAQDQVIGDPSIGVASTPSPEPAIRALEPNVHPILTAVATDLAARIAEREEARAWAAIEEARRTSNVEAEAALSALYLQIAPSSPRRNEILARLAEVMP